MSLTEESRTRLAADAATVIARYPEPRSALLPLLHLVQSEEGYVSPEGIELCAQWLDLTTAEVSAVATFYTMYKRRPVGDYHVGVCTNTLCAVMGGDQIFSELKDHLGVGNDEMTEDGKLTLEHIECNAACDYAPVVMVNWEFFDNQTPESAKELVDALRAGQEVVPTRGAKLCTFKQQERVLAGFYDGRADEGPAAGAPTLAGLELYRSGHDGQGLRGAPSPEGAAPAMGYGIAGGPSESDAPSETAEADPANPAQPGAVAADPETTPKQEDPQA